MNYYGLNPFDGPFGWNATKPSDPIPGPNNCGYWPKPDSQIAKLNSSALNITVCPDYIQRTPQDDQTAGPSLMRFSYYSEKLTALQQFQGFVPRWYVLASNTAKASKPDFTATQTLAIIDTELEINVGVGYDWYPLILKPGQIEIPEQLAIYLNATVGDQMNLYMPNIFQLAGNGARDKEYVNEGAIDMMTALMQTVASKFDYNFENGAFIHQDGSTLLDFNSNGSDTLLLPYELAGTYANNNGKFNSVLGNVVIVDCNYFFDDLIGALKDEAADIPDRQKRLEAKALLNFLKLEIDQNDLTACDFPYEIDGVLKDQASYYIKPYKEIVVALQEQTEYVGEAITANANATISAPLEAQFKTSSQTQSYLQATLLTVVVFLGILSSMLLYSLMLSDVDAKTYEYGMLRALGFKKPHLVGVITLKSMSFSIPGLIFGIFVAFVLNIGLRMIIFI